MADAALNKWNPGRRFLDRLNRLSAYWNFAAFLLTAFFFGLLVGAIWSDITWLGLVDSGWLKARMCL